MVKFRGIEISIISQFDIRKLPEFQFPETSPPDQAQTSPLNPKATASCYVPIYPGSQIWFEYNIDGPHPPEAAYFFKLLFNGRAVTNFDCGSKHNYHGKMMYNLMAQGRDEKGDIRIIRQALHFFNEPENGDSSQQEDVIEFSVHRIEHRKRVRELKDGIGAADIGLGQTLQYVDHPQPVTLLTSPAGWQTEEYSNPAFPSGATSISFLTLSTSPMQPSNSSAALMVRLSVAVVAHG